MISGANDKELELATARADILLMCGSETIKIIDKEIDKYKNIIDELEKLIEADWKYYGSISFNQYVEFDDEEQVNKFWQEYGEKEIVKKYKDKLKELRGDQYVEHN